MQDRTETVFAPRGSGIFLWALAALTLASAPAAPEVGLEYVAHACFVVTSPQGTRIAIDPFNSRIWLGYSFPETPPPADAVLVTHPHYDHDATYHWPQDVPVFRRPGRFAVGDVELYGVAGRHSDPYGKEFGQSNTIWVLETGGLRFAHLGDSGPLSGETIGELGSIDVLLMPVDSTFHILKSAEVDDILRRLRPRLVVPMHYLIPSLADDVEGLGPIDPWLEGRDNVLRVESSSTRLSAASLPEGGGVLVLAPSSSVAPWDAAYVAARRELAALGSDASPEERLATHRRAVERVPESISFAARLARELAAAGKTEEAIRTLERGLAGAGRDDWRSTDSARLGLARLYRETGRPRLAAQQCRLILRSSHDLEIRRRAEELLTEAP